MPAKPLSSVNRNATYGFGSDTLKKHSAFAPYIAQVISIGAVTEHKWSSVLVTLLKSDPKTGMAMYQALTSTSAQRAALNAAAKVRLSEEDFSLFEDVRKAISPARRTRNNFAHFLWGFSKELPDALLLIDPTCIQEQDILTARRNIRMVESGKVAIAKAADRSKMFVYRKPELEEAVLQANAALMIVVNFWLFLRAPHGPEGVETRTWLVEQTQAATAPLPPSLKSSQRSRHPKPTKDQAGKLK